MPTLKILTPSGEFYQHEFPEGSPPPSPEVVAQIVQQAGIKTVNPTNENPGVKESRADVQTPLASTDVSPMGAFRKSTSAILRAVKDRTTDPLQTVFTMSPKVGTWERLMAGAQLAGTVGAAPLAAAGAGVQAALEASGASPDMARLAGSGLEIGAGITGMVRSAKNAVNSAKTLLSSARNAPKSPAAQMAGMTKAEEVGGTLQRAARDEFRSLNTQFGRDFDNLERQIVRNKPQLMPGTPAWNDAAQIVNYLDDAAVSAGGQADNMIRVIRNALDPKNPKPISMGFLIRLRKKLHERAGVSTAFDPDASVVGKKAAELRDLTMDVIRQGADPNDAAAYDELRQAVRVQLYDPERFLSSLTSDTTTPLQAFKGLFLKDDPHTLRTLNNVIGGQPGMASKLKLGFAESMADVLTAPEGSKKALTRLNAFQPLLESTGLFKPAEIVDLRFLLEKNLVPSLISELTSNARASQVLLRGALGAQAATHIASHPLALTVSAIAFGGLPQLRRAAMLPAGSQAQQRMLAVVLKNVAQGASTLVSEPEPRPRKQSDQ